MLSEETLSTPAVFAVKSIMTSTSFGYRLASLRTQRRISSWDFAANLSISRMQLDRMERGECEVSIDLLEMVAQLFGMPVSKLLLGL